MNNVVNVVRFTLTQREHNERVPVEEAGPGKCYHTGREEAESTSSVYWRHYWHEMDGKR